MPEILPYASPAAQQPIADDLLQLRVITIAHDVIGILIAVPTALACIAFADEMPRFYLMGIASVGLAIAASGLCIHTRRLRIFSLIIAAFLAPMFPIGTMLGVSTLFVLQRQSVGALYQASIRNI